MKPGPTTSDIAPGRSGRSHDTGVGHSDSGSRGTGESREHRGPSSYNTHYPEPQNRGRSDGHDSRGRDHDSRTGNPSGGWSRDGSGHAGSPSHNDRGSSGGHDSSRDFRDAGRRGHDSDHRDGGHAGGVVPSLGSFGRRDHDRHGSPSGITLDRSAWRRDDHDSWTTHERHHFERDGHHDTRHRDTSDWHRDTSDWGRGSRWRGYGRDFDGVRGIEINNYYGYGPHYGNYFYNGCWNLYPRWHNHGYYFNYYSGVDYAYSYVSSYPCDDYGYYYWNDCSFVYPRVYYRRYPARNFYFFVDLGAYEERYVPTYVSTYQTNYYNYQEPVDVFESQNPIDAAYAAFAERRYYRSIVEFDRALASRPDDGLLYFARAQAYVATGDYRSAYDDIIRGMDLVPDWGRVMFNMRELYGEPGEFDRQLGTLEKWVDEHPEDYNGHFVLGYVYYFVQEYDLSKAAMVRTLAIVPNHPQADRLIRDIYERQSEADARREAEQKAAATGAAPAGAPAPSGPPRPLNATQPPATGQPSSATRPPTVTLPAQAPKK